MNLDRFVHTHAPTWERLERQARRAASNPSALSGEELRLLVEDYQRTSTHLSMARTSLGDAALVARLSTIVATAGAALYGTRPRTVESVVRFVRETFPAALWHLRWHLAVATALFLLTAFGLGRWAATSPAALDAAIPPALQDAIVAEDFVDYYRELPSAEFAAQVGFNNIQVAFLAFSTGIAGGLFTVYVLVVNAANVGFVGGLFHARGVAEVFWGFITPHGLIELTAVFVAAASGLALGMSWIVPGDRSRADALREEASRAITVVTGLVVVFAVAALVEGFVTGAALPTWLRVGVGVVVEVAFLAYAWVLGRAAASRSLSGTLRQADRVGWDAT